MVNVSDEEEPGEPEFKPDGGYIPRILFLQPSGTVMTDVINSKGSPQYKFYYHEPHAIVQSMKSAAALGQATDSGSDEL